MDNTENTPAEEFAFYESGLVAHGCLENLDTYTLEAIQRYGRILLKLHGHENETTICSVDLSKNH